MPARADVPSVVRDTTAFRPILKWAGGKARLVSHILERLPASIETYYEPFVGGAAVFFALAGAKRFRRAVLSDLNQDLVDSYRGVKKDVDGVIARLEDYRRKHNSDFYYETRQQDPKQLELVDRAARFIYLNKTGYNGLYRVNRQGQFNVPFGRYTNPAICDEPRLRIAAGALRRVKLDVMDFDVATEEAKPGDAVYFDPPYIPLSKTSSFTAYHRLEFGIEEHELLAARFLTLTERGVCAVLSNSDTPYTRRLYKKSQGLDVKSVLVARPINSKSTARGSVGELIVSNRVG